MATALVAPIIRVAAQAPATPSEPSKKAAEPPGPAKAAMERLAQKQRQATLAAMQASVDKQRASASAATAAFIGKQAPAKPPAANAEASFFTLQPLAPLENAAASFAMPAAAIPDVVCDPVPEADIAPVLLGAAERESLEPRLLSAVIQQESAFRPCAISQKGAQGLMQLMPDTAEHFGVKDPFDTKQNIDAGAKYLKELLTRYGGNLSLALGAYNAGPGKVDQAGGVPPIPETTAYVSEILSRLATHAPTPKPPTQ